MSDPTADTGKNAGLSIPGPASTQRGKGTNTGQQGQSSPSEQSSPSQSPVSEQSAASMQSSPSMKSGKGATPYTEKDQSPPPPLPPPATRTGKYDTNTNTNAGQDDSSKPDQGQTNRGDPRTQEEIDEDNKVADRLSLIIEDANERILPICQMIRKHIEAMDAKKEEDRDENELIKQVKPLLEQAEKTLNETKGAVNGADPEKKLSNRAKRNMQDHVATPSEQRLAEALKVMVENVEGTIQWAKGKLDAFPKAKKDLGPLLDALGQPLTQIVGGVGLLLAGVLNLLGKLLSGLGLDSLLKGIVAATGLDKIYKGLGLGSWLYGGDKKK